ncbi:hypothetical protein BD414DRAFT_536334 [Trametes punicea]|nr:hypothetical protein BD414DRAFT_536334 [Trametes punicea]
MQRRLQDGPLFKFKYLYRKAEKSDPKDPLYPSNLSTALFVAGDYVGYAATIVSAWKVLRDRSDAEHKPDLLIRLLERLAKALSFSVASSLASLHALRKYFADFEELKEHELPLDELRHLCFLCGGVGDGRHPLGTIVRLYQAYKKLPLAKASAFHAHLTLLDIHPTAITRDLCMLMLLHALSNATDSAARAEIKATLMLMSVAKKLCEKLSEHPPVLPSWLHVDAKTIPAVMRALDYWINTEKSRPCARVVLHPDGAGRVEKMKEEKWSMIPYRQDTSQQPTRPVPAHQWALVE